jgi:hypothetical protein
MDACNIGKDIPQNQNKFFLIANIMARKTNGRCTTFEGSERLFIGFN